MAAGIAGPPGGIDARFTRLRIREDAAVGADFPRVIGGGWLPNRTGARADGEIAIHRTPSGRAPQVIGEIN